jgi:hypothetical protein
MARKKEVAVCITDEQEAWLNEKVAQGYKKASLIRLLIGQYMASEAARKDPSELTVQVSKGPSLGPADSSGNEPKPRETGYPAEAAKGKTSWNLEELTTYECQTNALREELEKCVARAKMLNAKLVFVVPNEKLAEEVKEVTENRYRTIW